MRPLGMMVDDACRQGAVQRADPEEDHPSEALRIGRARPPGDPGALRSGAQGRPAPLNPVQGASGAPGASDTPARAPTATPSSGSQEPVIGPITFAADATEDNQPIGADTSFEADITEIHAIISYEGMSDGDTWERYWYQDGEEVGGGSDIWDGGESGTYDLSITNDGEPLGSGIWKLEIYVNGELAQTGSFVIESGAPAATCPSR